MVSCGTANVTANITYKYRIGVSVIPEAKLPTQFLNRFQYFPLRSRNFPEHFRDVPCVDGKLSSSDIRKFTTRQDA